MKKKLLVLSLIAICLAIMAAGTLAYFTGGVTAHNVITTGGVSVELIETTDGDLPFPAQGVSGVMPGDSVTKKVVVKNLGPSQAWVRLKLDVEVRDADGELMVLEDFPFTLNGADPDKWLVSANDPYVYYSQPLDLDESTVPFMDAVQFNDSMGNEFQGSTLSLKITVQAVQTANNGDTVYEATGWAED